MREKTIDRERRLLRGKTILLRLLREKTFERETTDTIERETTDTTEREDY